jgi:benzylsuccinate CoA-transferase BbsF subunit
VVLENFRGGGLDGLGLGYAEVAAGNPTVVYASSQGYGRGGPLDQMPAYGPLNLGFAGLHHLWNHPEAPYPCGTSLNHPDHMVSKVLGVAVLAALAHRDATGQGQHVEVAQAEGVAYLMGEVYLETALGVDRGAAGNRNDAAAPHGVYPCTGDDQWVAIAVADDDAWQRFRTVAGWPADPALSTLAGRLAVRDDLDGRVGAWTAGRDRWEVANLLQAHGVSAMPVLGPDDHHRDDHLATRRAIVTLYHPEVGPERHVANPLRLSSTPQRRGEAAPCLGADTKEVLTTVLGCSEAEVADLVARGVCR